MHGDPSGESGLIPFLAAGNFDVVIEATGIPSVVQPSFEVLRKRGILVVCGIHPRPASINLTRLVREHQEIRGSYRSPLLTWSRVLAYLADNAERVRTMISHRVPLSNALAGFELARNKAASKVIVQPLLCPTVC
jgi:threonine 3-dehydrogenase